MSPALLVHAAWIAAAAAVCVALCTIHSRRKPSLSFHRRRGSSSSSSRSCASSSSREVIGTNGNGAGDIGGATPAAKVSPTPGDTPPKQEQEQQNAGEAVTVIEVGTHGPIAPVFPAPDPIPPRRSLSAKHIRSAAERLGRIRSMRRGPAEDDVFVGLRGGDAADGDDRASVLWTKTIILGERCRVDHTGEDANLVRWKSYRPRQPRSVPVTRSNSFAGIGACKPRADARY